MESVKANRKATRERERERERERKGYINNINVHIFSKRSWKDKETEKREKIFNIFFLLKITFIRRERMSLSFA